ncbi:hypothetical protein EVAR_74405_1 [Eumeta japonica]|uniref:Uncharacterized protein n=1 Tax=Eumeta variegata TaxID=151549 RepID=A0A4C1SDF8_EUMVA|nr:hypothetical protein EVAR_74405_1 [Eumeta japonica]
MADTDSAQFTIGRMALVAVTCLGAQDGERSPGWLLKEISYMKRLKREQHRKTIWNPTRHADVWGEWSELPRPP